MNQEEVTRLNLVSKELQRKDELARELHHKDETEKLSRLLASGRSGRGMLPPAAPARPQPAGDTARFEIGTAAGNQNPIDLVRHAVEDAKRIIDNYEKSTIELESKIAELEARLNGERDRCTKLERMIQEIVQLVNPR